MEPVAIKWRMTFLPDAPNMSERKTDNRKPALCKNFSMRFFLGGYIVHDALAITGEMAQFPDALLRDEA